MSKRNLIIGIGIVIVLAIVLVLLVTTGRLRLPRVGGPPAEPPPPDAHLMATRNAYDIALLRAQEWQRDAKLFHINSEPGATGVTGRSDDWDLIYVSEQVKGKGFHIVISDRAITTAEEIPITAEGGELPENIISSQEAISRMRQIKGYENEQVRSVELVYGPDGEVWYWGIKTARGTVTINAKK